MSDRILKITALSSGKRRLLELLLGREAQEAATGDAHTPPGWSSHELSAAEQRIWFLDQLESGTATYHVPIALRLQGPLDAGVLERSWNEIVRRHDSLRTSYPSTAGAPMRKVAEYRTRPFEVLELHGTLHDAEFDAWFDHDVRRPFDLSAGPLWRASLARWSATDHVLLLVLHHIVCDGWSVNVLFSELSRMYEAFSRGEPPPMPELPLQYADFAERQRRLLDTPRMRERIAARRSLLASVPVLGLPTEKPRGGFRSSRGATVHAGISPSLHEALAELGKRHGATLSMTLLAGFQVLLSRWSGQDQFAIGLPAANRTWLDTEALIGLLANTLVVRADVSDDPPFALLLDCVRLACLDAYEHQEIQLEQILKGLDAPRLGGDQPLFQVMFNFAAAPLQDALLGALEIEPLAVSSGTAKSDLTLTITDVGSLHLSMEYATDLFDAGVAGSLLDSYQAILESAAARPECPVSRLALLSGARASEWLAATRGPRSKGCLCVPELLALQTARSPHVRAVVGKACSLTYAQLQQRVNRLAHFLIRHGIGPDLLVGVCLDRSEEILIAILAILQAGGAYVPLDPTYPAEYLRLVLEESAPAAVLTSEPLRSVLPDGTTHVICIDAETDRIAREPDHNPAPRAAPGNLAYIIYTSGSSGRPKGVAVEHHSVATFLEWALGQFSREDLAGMLASTSICFDLSVFEMFAPLACGGTVFLVDNVFELGDWAAGGALTFINTVSSALLELLHAGRIPPGVRVLGAAGEPLPESLARLVHSQGAGYRLFNLYGPTETTVYSTWADVAESDCERIPIGRPVTGTAVYVLDRQAQPVPAGVPGELYIGGAGVARGYWKQPTLTAERFLPDPFSSQPGARMYRTGDLARIRADGQLVYLGRSDNQVKLHGYRIEPEEIEAALTACPDVSQAAVVVGEERGQRFLNAYVVVAPGTSPITTELLSALSERLPRYAIPSTLVLLESLPVNNRGKVDRRRLSALAPLRPVPEQIRHEVSGEFETLVASVWQDLLGIEGVTAADNFFDRGGDSLLSVRVVALLEKQTGIRLELKDLMFQTLAQLAATLERKVRDKAGPVPGFSPKR